MTQTTIILSVAALVLFIINAKKTGRQFHGLESGLRQMLQSLPLILGAFVLAGMIGVLIPGEFVQNWLSKEAGLKGIILGAFGGMMLAVGPYASFPIVASVLASGAGLGTVVAMITGWCLLGLSKAPFEVAFYGVKFFVLKLIFSIPLCFGAGLLAHVLEMVLL